MATISRQKNVKVIYKSADHLSDRGYDLAVEVWVYDATTNKFVLVGGDYKIRSGSWIGLEACAIAVLKEHFTDLKCSTYTLHDNRVTLFQEI